MSLNEQMLNFLAIGEYLGTLTLIIRNECFLSCNHLCGSVGAPDDRLLRQGEHQLCG